MTATAAPVTPALPRTAYTVAEVATSIGVSVRHMRRLCDRGEIRVLRAGGRVLIPADAFRAFVGEAAFLAATTP